MDTVNYKCPNCSAGLAFDSKSQKMKCEYCGNTYSLEELEQLAAEKGNEYLHQMLLEVDPVSAKEIHANNVKRVIRALEFYHQNHFPISAHNQEQKEHETPYNLAYFVLNVPEIFFINVLMTVLMKCLRRDFLRKYRN